MGSWRYVYVVNGWMFFSDASVLSHDLTLQVSWSELSIATKQNQGRKQKCFISPSVTPDSVFLVPSGKLQKKKKALSLSMWSLNELSVCEERSYSLKQCE